MAGEIEEPFQFNFQADLLDSGSISFGRFESESLSWERRSSFSHNRYLEEVEKYSKPGSVTEKKAYFEAHFRRKMLLKQSSSESQDGREFRTSENDDDPQDLRDSENGNDSKHFTCFDESTRSSGHPKNDETKIQKCEKENVETLCSEDSNASSHVTSFDESLCNIGYEGGETLECEREELGVFSVAPKEVSPINTGDHMVNGPQYLKLEETHQIGTENVVLVKSEENTGDTLNDIVLVIDVASEANDSSLTSNTADKDNDSANSGSQQTLSSKVRPASEIKQTKPNLKAHANISRSNGSAKSKTREINGLFMKEKEKKLPRPASPIAHSGRRPSKSEETNISFTKAKVLPTKKSIVKDYRSEKTPETNSSVSKKSLPGARQTANRTKQTINLSKPHANQGVAGFAFRSDQRAERRKEEKRAAEMTQSQKSLNFKATPMPSFYKESARCSDQNKVISNRSRTPRTNNFSSDTRPSSSTSLTIRKSAVPEKRLQLQENKKEFSSQKQKDARATKGVHMGYLAVDVAT